MEELFSIYSTVTDLAKFFGLSISQFLSLKEYIPCRTNVEYSKEFLNAYDNGEKL